jgi:hypothetical protein
METGESFPGGAVGGSFSVQVSASEREPYVHASVSRLEMEVERLGQQLDALIQRLQPVFAPPSPISEDARVSEEIVPVPLAERIERQSVQLNAMTAIIMESYSRLEI